MNSTDRESARPRIQFRLATLFVIWTMCCVAFAILRTGEALPAKLALTGAFVLATALFLVAASYAPSAKPVRVGMQTLLGIIGAAIGLPIAFSLLHRASVDGAAWWMNPIVIGLSGAVVGGVLAVVVLRCFWRLDYRIQLPIRYRANAYEFSLYLAIGATLLAAAVLARGPRDGVARIVSVGMAGISSVASLVGFRLAVETLGDPQRTTRSGAGCALCNGLVIAFWILAGIYIYLAW